MGFNQPPHQQLLALASKWKTFLLFWNFFLAHKEKVSRLLIFLFRIYYCMHKAYQKLKDNQKLKQCAEIIKNDVEIRWKLKFCRDIPVVIYKGISPSINSFWNMFLINLTQCLSYWLCFLLFYCLVLDLKAQWN